MTQRFTFRPAAANALRAYRASKPWRGTFEERWAKLRTLHHGLCVAYRICPDLKFVAMRNGRPVSPEEAPTVGESERGDGGYIGGRNLIILFGKLSVVTYLFSFGLARGMVRRKALAWAQAAFARFFPRSFGRTVRQGELLVRAPMHDDDAGPVEDLGDDAGPGPIVPPPSAN